MEDVGDEREELFDVGEVEERGAPGEAKCLVKRKTYKVHRIQSPRTLLSQCFSIFTCLLQQFQGQLLAGSRD